MHFCFVIIIIFTHTSLSHSISSLLPSPAPLSSRPFYLFPSHRPPFVRLPRPFISVIFHYPVFLPGNMDVRKIQINALFIFDRYLPSNISNIQYLLMCFFLFDRNQTLIRVTENREPVISKEVSDLHSYCEPLHFLTF